MRVPIDIADALAAWLRAKGHSASPTPLPDDFADNLPTSLMTAIGGRRSSMVTDVHRVRVETYGATMADAMDEARLVFAAIDSINDVHPIIGGVQSYQSESGGLPVESDDPNHPDIPVCEFIAQITTRVIEQ